MHPVISVIIPVYQVEPYLCKCIGSVRCQTFRDIEIILVDDGSPDNCGKICDTYLAQDNRIRVIHQENKGLSAARNAGIAIARGEFLSFVDSDDWIEPDMLEFLYNDLAAEDADISVCGIYIHKNARTKKYGSTRRCVQSGCDIMRSLYLDPGCGMYAYNKLYRKELFHHICFPEGRIYEDCFIMPQLMHKVKKVVFHTRPKYHYVVRSGSLSNCRYTPKQLDLIDARRESLTFIQNNYPDLECFAKEDCVNAHFKILFSLFKLSNPEYREVEQRCILFLKENCGIILSSSRISQKRKLLFIILSINTNLCKSIIKTFRRSY